MTLNLSDIDIPQQSDEYPSLNIRSSVAYHGPPGTGKTTTSMGTVGTLVEEHGYGIDDVAWVTYRKSLAQDTLNQLHEWGLISDGQLNEPNEGVTRYIGTAHAVANRCGSIGGEPAEPWNRQDFCTDINIQYFSSEPWEDTAGKLLFSVFDWLRNQNTTPEDRETLSQCPHIDDLRDIWTGDLVEQWYRWEDYKAQRELIDFSEMLSQPLENGDSPGRDILVIDEYHDVTKLMHDLFRSWMEEAEIVIVAGDPHQVVNSYDGASPEYFESLDLPKIVLPESYRCHSNHFELGEAILNRSHDSPDIKLTAGGGIKQYNSPRFEYSQEAGWVSYPNPDQPGSPTQIVDTHDGSTMMLTRTQMQADGVCRALEDAGIAYTTQRDLKGWNTDNGSNKLLVHNILQKLEGISPADFGGSTYGLSKYSETETDTSNIALTNPETAKLFEIVDARTLDISRSEADDLVNELENSEGAKSLDEIDEYATQQLWERYTAGVGSVSRVNKTSLGTGKTADRAIEAVSAALQRYDDPIRVSDIDTKVITIHASKGMEADDVVLYDGISSRIENEMRHNQQTRENEHRTWYVALTRAQERLHIMRNGFDWCNPMIPTNVREVIDV